MKKRIVTGIGLFIGLLCGPTALANPQGPQVINGQVIFEHPDAQNLNIHNSPNAIINWQSFGINPDEATRFIQQSTSSAVLNRVVGQDPSAILGQLLSNGRVFLINANGIVFGPDSVVDTAGLIASTLNITDEDFINGNLKFAAGANAGAIDNKGYIKTGKGGNIALIAPNIKNSGIIETQGGNLILAAGEKVTIASFDSGDVLFEVQAPEHEAINLGKMIANGGAARVFAGTIKHSGDISADSISVDATGNVQLVAKSDIDIAPEATVTANGPSGGNIHIESQQGTAWVKGTVEAAGSAEKGGSVKVLGEQVAVYERARIDVSGPKGGGSALIGGDIKGENPNVRNAKAVFVGSDAEVKADALDTGDGGKVVVYADDATRIHGRLSARGGARGGDGGFIETSGKKTFEITTTPDISAPKGKAGEWLIDPNNLDIVAGSGATNVTNQPPDFATTDDNAQLGVDLITGAMTGGATVTVTTETGRANTQDGDINVNATIDLENTVGTNTLQLNAHNNINLNQPILDSAPGGQSLNLVLNADRDFSAVGDVNVRTDWIDLGGGSLDANYVNIGQTTNINADINVSNLNVSAGITATVNGNIDVFSRLIVDDATLTGSGDITLTPESVLSFNGVIAGDGSLSTGFITFIDLADLRAATLGGNRVWDNFGDIFFSVDAANDFTIDAGARLINHGQFWIEDALNGADILGGGTFDNPGTLVKSTPTETQIDPIFNNTGIVDVLAGSLRLDNGGTDTGAYHLAGGTALQFNSGTRIAGAGASINPLNPGDQGTLRLAGGTWQIDTGLILPTGITFDFDSGTLAGSGGITVANLAFDSNGVRTLNGATLNVNDFILSQGTLQAEAGAVNAAGISRVDAGATLGLNGATFNITSDFLVDGTLNLTSGMIMGAKLVIGSTGAMRTAGAGSFGFAGFINDGLVELNAGDLALTNPFPPVTHQGDFVVAAGRTLTFDGLPETINGSVTGVGNLVNRTDLTIDVLNIGGLASLEAESSLTLVQDSQTNGLSVTSGSQLHLNGDLTVNGTAQFQFGDIFGPGSLNTNGESIVDNLNLDGVTWNNNGTANFDSTATAFAVLGLFNNAIVNNQAGATLRVNTEAFIQGSGQFIQNGGLLVDGGSLILANNGGAFSGDVTVAAGRSLLIAEGEYSWFGGTLSGTGVIDGAGASEFNIAGAATKILDGPTLNVNDFVLSQGTLDAAGGTVNATGQSRVDAGATLGLNGATFNIATDLLVDGTLNLTSGIIMGAKLIIGSTGAMRTAGAGSFGFAGFINDGLVELNAGDLALTSPEIVAHQGDFVVAAGRTLTFDGLPQTVSGSVTGTGNLVNRTALTLNAMNIGNLALDNAVLTLNQPSSVGGLTLMDSTLAGAALTTTGTANIGGFENTIESTLLTLGSTTVAGSMVLNGSIGNLGTLAWMDGGISGNGSFDNQGTFNLQTGGGFAPQFTNSGTLNSSISGNNSAFGGLFTNTGNVLITESTIGFMNGYVQSAGITQLNNGAITTTPSDFSLNGGLLSGTGTVNGNVLNNAGRIAAGFSPGQITIGGNYTQGPAGVLAIEIGGTSIPGVDFDALNITGSANLNGTLIIEFFGGFTTSSGATIPFLNYQNASGAFATVLAPVGFFSSIVDQGAFAEVTIIPQSLLNIAEISNSGIDAILALQEPIDMFLGEQLGGLDTGPAGKKSNLLCR